MNKIFFANIFYLLFMGLGNNLRAQSNVTLPKIIPPNPEAAAFIRYGEIPISHSTGVPQIGVDLYKVSSRKLSLPISISYHGAGIKVRDISTPLGLGWVLNCGGLVSRTIFGKPDEDGVKPAYRTKEEKDAAVLAASTYVDEVVKVCNKLDIDYKYNDHQSDRFYYQLPGGGSGTFRYNFINDQLVKIPYSPVVIKKNLTQPNPNYPPKLDFEIVAEDGTRSFFDGKMTVGDINTWSIRKMISADLSDTIEFFYNGLNYNTYVDYSFSQTFEWGTYWDIDDPGDLCPTLKEIKPNQISFSKNFEAVNSIAPLLDSIVSATTVVKFDYLGDRRDKGQYRLNKISIYSKLTRERIREFSFDQSYFGTSADKNLRLRLDGLQVKGKGIESIEKYSFDYESLMLPAYSDLNNQNFYEDYWGYYNGTSNQSLIPGHYLPVQYRIPQYMSNRMPNPSFAKACMLKSIQYPGKGKVIFRFEPNEAADYVYEYPGENGGQSYNTGGYLGGFRIKQIISYSSPNDSVRTTYDYTNYENILINDPLFTYEQRYFYIWFVRTCGPMFMTNFRKFATAVPSLPLTAGNESPIIYTSIDEYKGTVSDNIGKITYTYERPPIDPVDFLHPRYKDTYHFDRGNYSTRLLGKSEYKKVNGDYQIVKGEEYKYTPFRSNIFNTGIKIIKTTSYILGQGAVESSPYYYDNGPGFHYNYPDQYNYSNTLAYEEVKLLTESKTWDFSDLNNPVIQNVFYKYDNQDHLQPTLKYTINSSGDTLKTDMKYPADFKLQEPYATMISRNIIQPVVEQKEYKNSLFLQSIKTNYKAWTSKSIDPETIEVKVGSNPSENRLRYYAYDEKGNLTSVSKEKDIRIGYVYGYKQTLPIIEAQNTTDSALRAKLTIVLVEMGYTGTNSLDKLLTDIGVLDTEVRKIKWITFNQKLRSKFTGEAKLNTYTYAPLTGVTSSTSINNITTYYDYDLFGRLKAIKDHKGNILKTFDYNYKVTAPATSSN